MSVLGVIPARFASSRFHGKPLELIRGCTGIQKSLVQRTWETVSKAKRIDRLVVATDDLRIQREVESFGGETVMTSSACGNGTERCAETMDYFGDEFEWVVNVQGDALLTPPWFVDELVVAMERQNNISVATPVIRCDQVTLERLRQDNQNGLVGATTVVFGTEGQALYFSKQIIPWKNDNQSLDELYFPVYHHVGVYIYSAEALRFYLSCRPSPLEQQEGLEQLRFLENGEPILCVEVEAEGHDFWEVNNPEDIARVEASLCAGEIE